MYRSGTHSDKTPYCKVLDPSTGLTKYKHGVAPIFEDEFITIIKKKICIIYALVISTISKPSFLKTSINNLISVMKSFRVDIHAYICPLFW